MPTLTNRQAEILAFVNAFFAENSLMPSSREIQAAFGFSSQTAAMGHLRALERKGALVRHPNKARAYVLPRVESKAPTVQITGGGGFAAEALTFRLS